MWTRLIIHLFSCTSKHNPRSSLLIFASVTIALALTICYFLVFAQIQEILVLNGVGLSSKVGVRTARYLYLSTKSENGCRTSYIAKCRFLRLSLPILSILIWHLSKAFFKSARGMLSKGGEIHVSHMVGYPYDQWKLKELAEKAGLFLKEKVWFNKSDYPGYHSKRAGGIQSNKMFRPNKKTCYTFKFSLNQTSSELSVCNPTTSIVSDGPSPPGYQGYLCPPAPPSPTPSPRLDDYEPPAAPSPPLPPSCQDDDDPPAAPTPPSRQVNEDIGCYSVLRGCLCAIFRCWPDIGRSLL
ncbi:uncharacterized protein LOC125474485 isoform X3 [Pyrus x bretschneideri]|uniref:uncharacterized protein LOC125474485 isoform X3 n=1 Tax=Pyrus x bretschneideri TaxID=225117 RepID=UPI00202DD0E0|nr:uncharacterized protein LOC125474485 isoform X3 [Pyrus x bretschneideri]XP_048434253.1 uncharacterized protein LOC125474485 isoform X3 [Pyrus x bretschneideri]